jgi:hypothetical protein
VILRNQVKICGRWWNLHEIGKDSVAVWIRDHLRLVNKSQVEGYRVHPIEDEEKGGDENA